MLYVILNILGNTIPCSFMMLGYSNSPAHPILL